MSVRIIIDSASDFTKERMWVRVQSVWHSSINSVRDLEKM